MTAQHKAEKTARLLAFAAAKESWSRMDRGTRSELGAAMKLATVRLRDAVPTAAPLVANVAVIL